MRRRSKRINTHQNIRYSYYNKYKDMKEVIEKRYNILMILIIVIIMIMIANLFYVQIIQNEYYINQVEKLTENTVEGSSAPRGRIYDRNHRLIVDNIPVKVIYYKKPNGVTTEQELALAMKVAEYISVDYTKLTDKQLRNYWVLKNPEKADAKITKKERQKVKERKLTSKDIENYKLERVTEEELAQLTDIDREAAYIYALMNTGYSYAEKVIKKEGITDEEYAKVSENVANLNGINTRLDWERSYPYGEVFRTILGSVSTSESGIPYELKNYYLSKGYSLNDRVGTSYLEYQYEDVLKGEKNVYEITNSGEYKLVKEGSRGNDAVLTIDIELQKEVERILTEEVLKAKTEPNTKYYDRSFVVIQNPKTGEILAMAGKQVKQEADGSYKVYDYTPGITTSPVVVGSVVKGASHIVGYNTGALKIGEKRYDTCIKIAATPIKCSWKYLGNLNDITALKYSSNTYQFNTAIKVGKGNYVYDKPLSIDKTAFDIYRNTFAQFGLGVKTGIDLPVESLGYKGKSEVTGHLLDFSIGQYDTYTPVQLSQYIGTLANNGTRVRPYLLKEVYKPEKKPLQNLLSQTSPEVLNKVDTKQEYLDRVEEGFKEVMTTNGTGSGFMNLAYKPAGKTGTSQSFVDTDGDGVVDLETITNTFVAYAPYDDPKVTFTVISPDIYYQGAPSSYESTVNKRISQQVSNKYFEMYP